MGLKVAEHIFTYIDPPCEKDLERAVVVLRKDGVIAYPTDVNWAFGCAASSVKGLDRIRSLKPHHPKDRPFSFLCGSISMAAEIGVIDHQAYSMLKKAWPGPYTVLLKANRSLPRQLKETRPVVGIRVPDNPLLLALIERLQEPLITTSAPELTSGGPAHHGYEIEDEFGHGLDVILDLGEELVGAESTIVDLTEGAPTLVRAGNGDVSIFGLTIGDHEGSS